MNKYIVIAFAFLGVWFYEASGGADFEPGETSVVVFAEPKPVAPRAEPREDLVARADTTTSLSEILPARAISTLDEVEPVDTTAGLTLVTLDAPVAEPEPEIEAVVENPTPEIKKPFLDLRFVDGDRVNMRGGPGTDYAVVGKLVRNDMVEVLEDNGSGWLHLRDTASGQKGWMADWLVTASN